MSEIKYLIVSVKVRYWEDTAVNDIDDIDGKLIPCRDGDVWEPIINLDTGEIINWEDGFFADIHYKVCDNGRYWLADSNQNKIFKYKGNYVPDSLLCIGDKGYGDYIILKVESNGYITNWDCPEIDFNHWEKIQ